jgi:small subunit ribosomal protein S17
VETKRKTKVGIVVSNKMDKTVVVAVETIKRHQLYGKTFKKMVKYKVHDENNSCQLGDKIRIVETRPLSRQKRWRVAEVITRKEVPEVTPQEIT